MLSQLVPVMHFNITKLAPSVDTCAIKKYTQPLHTINVDLKVYRNILFDIRFWGAKVFQFIANFTIQYTSGKIYNISSSQNDLCFIWNMRWKKTKRPDFTTL